MSVSECLETFYSFLIIEELKKHGCNNDNKLIAALDNIKEVYSYSALKSGDTYLDYNNPWNRCAYLCKFGIMHTGMVRKYFKKLVINAAVKENLKSKSSIKICCLGGGAGTDVVGIFKVLSKYSELYGKVVQVTVLDICGGWRNTFNEVMSRLVAGKVKNIPSDFVDAGKFAYKLIQVDLLQPLPSKVAQILAEADVVCMVKFVSAVTGKPGATDALKVILEALKLESVLLFIDNNYRQLVTSVEIIANSCAGFSMILGPMHSTFARVKKSNKKPMKLRVSVMGWIKKAIASDVCSAVAQQDSKITDEEDCWATDSSSASDYDIAETYETAMHEQFDGFSNVSNKPKEDLVSLNLFSLIKQNETKIAKQEKPTSTKPKHNEKQVAVNGKDTQALSAKTKNNKSNQTPVKPQQCSANANIMSLLKSVNKSSKGKIMSPKGVSLGGQTIIKTKNKETQTVKKTHINKHQWSQTMSYNDLIQALVMSQTAEQVMKTPLQHAFLSCSDLSYLRLFLKDVDRLLSNLSKLALSDTDQNCCCEGRCHKTIEASTSTGSATDASFVFPSKYARELSEVISVLLAPHQPI